MKFVYICGHVGVFMPVYVLVGGYGSVDFIRSFSFKNWEPLKPVSHFIMGNIHRYDFYPHPYFTFPKYGNVNWHQPIFHV